MTINGLDYTFAARTGNFNLEFGEAYDCNGNVATPNCPHFGNVVINTLGTGLILDKNVKFNSFILKVCDVYMTIFRI
jgi:hypothetical protein